VHTVRYLIRPLRIAGREVRTHVFNAGAQPLPPSSYADARAFVDRFRDAERQPAVLIRQR
jgi:hypothetical protein